MAKTFIYAIYNEFDNVVKIGVSSEPTRRLETLQTAVIHRLDLLLCFAGGYPVETRLHQQLKKYRKSGEWFEANAEVFAALNTELLASISDRFGNLTLQSTLSFVEVSIAEYFHKYKKAKRIRFKEFYKDFSKKYEGKENQVKEWLENLGYHPKPDVNRVLWYTNK